MYFTTFGSLTSIYKPARDGGGRLTWHSLIMFATTINKLLIYSNSQCTIYYTYIYRQIKVKLD